MTRETEVNFPVSLARVWTISHVIPHRMPRHSQQYALSADALPGLSLQEMTHIKYLSCVKNGPTETPRLCGSSLFYWLSACCSYFSVLLDRSSAFDRADLKILINDPQKRPSAQTVIQKKGFHSQAALQKAFMLLSLITADSNSLHSILSKPFHPL